MVSSDDENDDMTNDQIKDNNSNNSNDSEKTSPVQSKRKNFKKKSDMMEVYNETMEWMNQFKEDQAVFSKKKENVTLPWIEKFRPDTLDQIISHNNIINTLKTFIKKRQFPHLILRGPPGTGKTSAIMACARELYGNNYSIMVLDINASEERGIEVVRNKINDFVTTKGVFLEKNISTFKMVILDEADAMTSDAQAMLVGVIEKFAINVRFCLICNYIKKISPAIQSRCTIFKFSPLRKSDIAKKLNDISIEMNLKITSDGIDTIIKISKGDMRRVLNILQATSMAYSEINEKNVANCIGYPHSSDMKIIMNSLMTKKYSITYSDISNIIAQNGYSMSDVINEITDTVLNKFMNNEISQQEIIMIFSNLRNIEMNLTICPNESIQLCGLIGLFKLAFKS